MKRTQLSKQPAATFTRAWFAVVVVLLVQPTLVRCCGDEVQGVLKRIELHLDSAEFGPAIKLTQQTTSSDLCAEGLSRIARSQFNAGARSAAFETASLIADEQARSSLLGDLASRRLEPGEQELSALRSSDGTTSSPTRESTEDASTFGKFGGGAVADFEPLMELIRSTIKPGSWDDAGGDGTMSEFYSGVTVDPSGLLKRIAFDAINPRLEKLRTDSIAPDFDSKSAEAEVHRTSSLRKVSLTRLEKELQLRTAAGLPLDPAMSNFAGIWQIKYLLVYPETGDIVIAGPAGDWQIDREGRTVNRESGRPLLGLDDFVVCLRNAFDGGGRFGCSIDPRAENLAATQKFLATSKLKGERWREGIREALGQQDIVVDGIDPRTSTARTIVEADYRMKLAGMGLEPGTTDVRSYLDLVTLDKNGNPPPMDVARWWFTMNYKSIAATESRDAFELIGNGVKVLSEQEMVNEKGERNRTGRTGGPTLEFADSFTTHFADMAAAYPIYSELKNVFDFALITAIIRDQKIDSQVNWRRTYFGSATDRNQLVYEVPMGPSPAKVDSVMNHRIIEATRNGRKLRHTIQGVSGGVQVSTEQMLDRITAPDPQSAIVDSVRTSQPVDLQHHQWWWD